MKLAEVLKVLLVAAMVMTTAKAIWLEMPATGIKCVYEEIHNNVVVLADYAVIGDEEHAQANILPTISVKVTSPFGNNLHHEENVTYGQFAFTTTEAGNYMACFRMNSHAPGSKGVTIGIDWKTGIAAKDWDSIARKEKIKDVELVLMILQDRVQAIHEKLVNLKKREEEMREVSEKTNAEVAWFSILSLSVCILAAAMQVWYLKRFFRKKKLI
ncbi:PREDICTED: transmembrane emp24 domain-containing protein p24delta3-like [Nicotiana attenuata]|uniref:Transmembrane emp24 domain-containing protein p24delta3 n=1 Tax=Nicotiana attenuata TaxID=49451 RepID=A0A1J6IPB7_NICAT|nr:PREDICTED: transmembrane emp24 domain-containing protein p24delta3-like [Nicotiana attenuata]OIT02400.1 transmembrane emp24 domain-containing protein p24delta3 [Nicotiana attenuata]